MAEGNEMGTVFVCKTNCRKKVPFYPVFSNSYSADNNITTDF